MKADARKMTISGESAKGHVLVKNYAISPGTPEEESAQIISSLGDYLGHFIKRKESPYGEIKINYRAENGG